VLGISIYILTRDISVDKFRDKMGKLSFSEGRQYARSVVEKYPSSEAALYAVLVHLYDKDDNGNFLDKSLQISNLKSALKHHPESIELLSELALVTRSYFRKESVTYSKKVLRLDPLHFDSHNMLGAMYQELGDYKTALVYLKKAQKLLHAKMAEPYVPPAGDIEFDYQIEIDGEVKVLSADEWSDDYISRNIVAIEGGTPLLGPRSKKYLSGLRVVSTQVMDQRERQEFESFLQWIKTIEAAESPADLEDFLMRELALHLQGKTAVFEVERIIRAYETQVVSASKHSLKKEKYNETHN
jgi:tetratricopeptide (TPR) repeat protein